MSQMLTQETVRSQAPLSGLHPDEETLIPDTRGDLTPAQVVENRLATMTRTGPVLVSHLQNMVRQRPH